MFNNKTKNTIIKNKSDWLTIPEAVYLANQKKTEKQLTDSDVYRHALSWNIYLSIYFQSTIILRKVTKIKNKIKLKKIGNSLTDRLCYLDTHCFIKHINYTTLTQDKYIHSKKMGHWYHSDRVWIRNNSTLTGALNQYISTNHRQSMY